MTRRPELSLQRTKRSIVIAGHKTSLSLEAAFWGSLKEIAAHEGVSVVAALTRIVTTRTCHRLYVLDHYRRLAEAKSGTENKR